MDKNQPLIKASEHTKGPPLADDARHIAAVCIEQVLIQKRALDTLFSSLPEFLALSAQDRAFCQRLTRSTLRHLGEFEQMFAGYFTRPIQKEKTIIMAHIYIAATQIAYENIPPYAALNSAVNLTKMQYPKFAGVVNATLRRWLRERDAAKTLPPEVNIPPWLLDRWQQSYGNITKHIAAALADEPPLDLSFINAEARQRCLNALGGEAISIGASARVFKHMAVTELPEYEQGTWWVQDAAASLPAYLLGDIKGKRALDMCAAPGGKALQLAALGAKVTALDNQEKRLQIMAQNLKRVSSNIQLELADALDYKPDTLFDVILLDAPCSATGTLRRNPDVKYIRTQKNLLNATRKQAALLKKALTLLKPGGKLVYCVCSMEKEEGEDIIAALLAKRDDVRLNNDPRLLPLDVMDSGGLGFRTHPAMLREHGGMDGFFMTCLEKL